MSKLRYGYEDDDRERGILSSADRRFLATGGDHLKNDNTRNNTARRIRQRIRDAIIDFDLITRLMAEEDDLEKVFDAGDDVEDVRFRAGMKSMIEYLYRGLDVGDAGIDFETVLESGVHDAEIQQTQGPATVRVEFDVDVVSTSPHQNIQRAKEKFENDESLSVEEVGALIALGEVEGDDLHDLAEHAQERTTFPVSVSPMLGHEMASITSDEAKQKRYRNETDTDLPLLHDEDDKARRLLTQFTTRGEAMPVLIRSMEEERGQTWDEINAEPLPSEESSDEDDESEE